jgi:curved DNA-binding protein CbpA
MSSHLPIDPYAVLGVPKDADLSAIRNSFRKLALKYHPDRLKNESERANGLEIFQKVQEAHEILSDDSSRSRYDIQVKLAELRKEMMAWEEAREATQKPSGFEPRDGSMYEERRPKSSYHDSGKVFARDSARNYHDDEITSSARRKSSRRHDEHDSRWLEKERSSERGEKAAIGAPLNAAITSKH